MIARITDESGVVATLEDDLRWTAFDPAAADALNARLAACPKSPALGDWVRVHVLEVAAAFGAAAEFAPRPADPPGRVY